MQIVATNFSMKSKQRIIALTRGYGMRGKNMCMDKFVRM